MEFLGLFIFDIFFWVYSLPESDKSATFYPEKPIRELDDFILTWQHAEMLIQKMRNFDPFR